MEKGEREKIGKEIKKDMLPFYMFGKSVGRQRKENNIFNLDICFCLNTPNKSYNVRFDDR